MRYKYKIFSALVVFSLFMAGITFSISYSGDKVNELNNPFYFIPENSTFLFYSKEGNLKVYTFVTGNTGGAVINLPVNQFGGISAVFPKDIRDNISLNYIDSILGYPIYKITISAKNLNQSNSSIGLYQKLFPSNTFYFSNPLPSIDILGSLTAIEDALIAYSKNQAGNTSIENFIDTDSQFSFLYMSHHGNPVRFISANITPNAIFASIMFNNSVNVNKIYILLLGILPPYIMVYPPTGEKIELRISMGNNNAIEFITKIILSAVIG